jgi:diguanylate cyclase (GGDEF)-like protein
MERLIKDSIRKIVKYFASHKRINLIIGIFIVVVILGFLDYQTGFEFSFSLFYLFPVSIAAWYISRNISIFVSLISALTWFISNKIAGETYTLSLIGYWNTIVRFGYFVIVSLLLTYLKQSLDRERSIARTDYVTGINNSRAFYQLASMEILRARRHHYPFTVAYIDLDNFKQVNDNFGHSIGDKVLKVVASTFNLILRRTDLVARLGGDEFAVLLPETDYQQARLVINKIKSIMMEKMKQDDWPVTFSIGAVTFNAIPLSVDEMIHIVDGLMYQVKMDGKNDIRFAEFPENEPT